MPVDDLRAEAGNVGALPDGFHERRPVQVECNALVLAEQHGQRGPQTDQHIGAAASRTALASALQTEQTAADHGKRQPKE